ncbi:unnamed protein product, partial [Porites evermanni]
MQNVSRQQFDDAKNSYHVPLSEFHADEWKKEVTSHAQDSPKHRTCFPSKITAEKAKLTSRVQKYHEERECDEHPSTSTQCTLSEIIKGNFPWGNNERGSIVL